MPYTITLATQAKETVCIYSDQSSIISFFDRLALPHVMLFDASRTNMGKTNKIKMVARVFYTIVYRRYLILRRIRKINPSEIYFFHDSFGTMELWLISKLAKIASIVYCPVLRHSGQKESRGAIPRTALCMYEKLFWGISRYPIDYGKVRWYVEDSFFEKHSITIKQVQISIPQEISAQLRQTYSSQHKVVILVENICENPFVEKEFYFGVVQEIINRIGSENIVLKNHPRFPFDLKQYLQGDHEELQSDVPINLLLQDYKVVIGNWTSVLFEAEPYGVNAISLLEILRSHYKTDMYGGHLRYLQDNDVNNKIVYPHSVEELCNIVKNYV